VASNDIGADARQTFTLTVGEDPAITSANGFNFAVGVSGQFSVHTYGYPQPALAVSGELPVGITYHDAGDGSAAFTGMPAVGTDGDYPLTLQADNGSGKPASQSFTLVVGKTVPALQIAPSVSSSVFGQEVTFSAIPAASLKIPSGLVTFVLDGVPAGDAQPLVDGIATLRIHTLAVGSHTIGAVYSGDGYYRSSRASAAQPFVVAPAGTALSLTVQRGMSTELTVTVSAVAPGAGTPTGQVSVYDGDQLIGSGTLDGRGKVVIAAPAIPPNPHVFLIVYAGDGNFTASQQVFEDLVYFFPAVFA
jgi:large repetitive protein